VAGQSATSAAAAAAPGCSAAQVTGLSKTLNSFEAGASAGPGVMFGVAEVVLSQPLPGPLGAAQTQLLQAAASGVVTISTKGPFEIEQLRYDIEELAVFDDYANAFVALGADQMDAFASEFSTVIQPFDLTLHQMAGILRAEEAQPHPCTPTVPASGTPAGQVALAFATGDGKKAAALISSLGLTSNAAVLGQAVFLGGIASVAARSFDDFRTAVAYAFPYGGVSLGTATQAFVAAATDAVEGGLTPDEGFLGGRTVFDTYAAYAKKALGG
jgi:hypothetical protein